MIIWMFLIKILVLCVFEIFSLVLKCWVRKADKEEVMSTFLHTATLYIWYPRWRDVVVLATGLQQWFDTERVALFQRVCDSIFTSSLRPTLVLFLCTIFVFADSYLWSIFFIPSLTPPFDFSLNHIHFCHFSFLRACKFVWCVMNKNVLMFCHRTFLEYRSDKYQIKWRLEI